MNLDAVNKWLTLLANFGVIGGLLLVAFQINFNTETIRLQNAIELDRGMDAGELANMGDTTHIAYATALFHPAKLTEAQIGQLWSYLNNVMLTAQSTWRAHDAGLASEESWAYAKRFAAGNLGFRVGRIWWKTAGQFSFEPEFVKAIDAELDGTDPALTEHATRKILDESRNLDREAAASSPTDGPSSHS